MPDGPAQVERDAEMAKGMTDWSYRAIAWVYGHDAGDADQPRSRRNRRDVDAPERR